MMNAIEIFLHIYKNCREQEAFPAETDLKFVENWLPVFKGTDIAEDLFQ